MVDTLTKRDYKLNFPKEGLLGTDVEVLKFFQKRRARKAAVEAVHAKNIAPKERIILNKYIRNHQISKTEEEGIAFLETTHKGLQAINDDLFGIGRDVKQFYELGAEFYRKEGAQLNVEELAYAEKFLREIETVLDNDLRKYLDELHEAINGREMATGSLNLALKQYNISGFFHPIRNFFEWWNMRSATKAIFKIEDRLKKIENKDKLSPADIKHYLQYDKAFAEDVAMTVKNLCIYALIIIRNSDSVADAFFKAADPRFENYDLPQRFVEFHDELVHMLNDEDSAIKSLNKMRLQLSDLAIKMHKELDRAQKDRHNAELEKKRLAA